jgi:hypothetical protein
MDAAMRELQHARQILAEQYQAQAVRTDVMAEAIDEMQDERTQP